MSNKLVVITGPTGSGKSTVSLALAKKLGKCVYVDIDHVKHMIISGFVRQTRPDGEKIWSYNEWALVGESVGMLSKHFLDKGFDVVVGGYMHEEGWVELAQRVRADYQFLLMPSKETVKIRDIERDAKYVMGQDAVEEHFDYILQSAIFEQFIVVDSTEQTVDETVDVILGRVANA